MTKEEAKNVLFGKDGYVGYWDKTIARSFSRTTTPKAAVRTCPDRICGSIKTL